MADSIRILSKDDIWAAKDIEERVVPIPQWGEGVGVRIRTFSKKKADEMRKRATHVDRHTKQDVVDNEMLEALLFVEGVIEPKFELDDYDRLQEKSAVAVGLVLRAIMDASGLSQLAVSEADKSPGIGSDTEVRVRPGTGTEDDASGTPGEDVRPRVRRLARAVQP